MQKVQYRDDATVELVNTTNADDLIVVSAARISTGTAIGSDRPEPGSKEDLANQGLIKYLMAHRHGSPFEHASFTFRIEIPLFVARELHRHRIASYNEMSGRYTEMLPQFYMPNKNRPLINEGTSARPELVLEESDENFQVVESCNHEVVETAWRAYQIQIGRGVANEVARIVLPLSTYTQMYMTVNARSLMNLLSLRIRHEDNTYDTRPLFEIQQMADRMEEFFQSRMPYTHGAWVKNGRVAP